MWPFIVGFLAMVLPQIIFIAIDDYERQKSINQAKKEGRW